MERGIGVAAESPFLAVAREIEAMDDAALEKEPQQTAAAARALQAGGRPFEPGTAHRRGSASQAGTSVPTLADNKS